MLHKAATKAVKEWKIVPAKKMGENGFFISRDFD